ncbi:MAG: CpaF family protein, partial [Aggregatilineales bacterium]
MLAKRINQANIPAQPPFVAPPPVERPAAPPPPKAENKPMRIDSNVPTKRRSSPKIAELRKQLRAKLLATPNEADEWKRDNPDHQKVISDRLQIYLQRANISLSGAEVDELRKGLFDDLLGFGAIQSLVEDRSFSEIMVNGPEIIFAERRGKLIETDLMFDDNDHVLWTATRIVRRIGRSIDRHDPMTDARLPDGSRVHIIIPPSAMLGPTITIRKFPEKVLTPKDLIDFGSLTPDVADFLEACVVARLNIVVSGGTGSGKTTLLNALSSFIPADERI